MPGWDEIEVLASDAAGAMTHPTGLILAADRVVQLPEGHEGMEAKCIHTRRISATEHVQVFKINEREVVPLGIYGMSNVPVAYNGRRDDGDPSFHPRGWILMRHHWAMGLCACGTLYWKPLWEERYVS